MSESVAALRRSLESMKSTQELLHRVGVSSPDAARLEQSLAWLDSEIAACEQAITRLERDQADRV